MACSEQPATRSFLRVRKIHLKGREVTSHSNTCPATRPIRIGTKRCWSTEVNPKVTRGIPSQRFQLTSTSWLCNTRELGLRTSMDSGTKVNKVTLLPPKSRGVGKRTSKQSRVVLQRIRLKLKGRRARNGAPNIKTRTRIKSLTPRQKVQRWFKGSCHSPIKPKKNEPKPKK